MIHDNSVQSYHTLDKATREAIVLKVYEESGEPLTDRQVASKLGYRDMNAVRPRITELKARGELIEVGKVQDPYSGKTVRMVRRSRPDAVQLTFGEVI